MARYQDGELLPPTPEDAAIFRRQFERMARWTKDCDTATTIRALRNWCGDYLHRYAGWPSL